MARGGACFDESGRLAGSNLDMAWAVHNAIEMLDLPIEVAIAMASRTPATFLRMGTDRGKIASGYCADLVLLSEDLHVRNTWIGGIAEDPESS